MKNILIHKNELILAYADDIAVIVRNKVNLIKILDILKIEG
jgi:hypothetical protein